MSDMELEEMRQQMALLKDKLNNQQIVNEHLVLESIKGKVKTLNRERWRKRFLIVLAIIYCPWACFKLLNMPLWFSIATVVLLLIPFLYDEFAIGTIRQEEVSSHGMVEMGQRVVDMKQRHTRWLWIGIPMLIAWFLAFVVLAVRQSPLSKEDTQYLIFGIVLGAVIGGLIGLRIYRRNQWLLDDLRNSLANSDSL